MSPSSTRRPSSLRSLGLALSAFAALFASADSRGAGPEDGWIDFPFFSYEGRDPVFDQDPPSAREYYNPILAGFHPDPSVCRVGEDYYLVNSTFSYFPGVPIFHSRNLVDWTQLGHVLDRPSQLNLDGLPVSSGIYAPAISWHNGVFYLITTNVRGIGNFYVTAVNPAGPWSDPVPLAFDGIDPSIFFDDDGGAYIVHNGPAPDNKPLYDGHRAIWLWDFDPAARTVKNGRILVNGGVDLSQKPVWIEGPHLFKRNGYYYLTCAEGGTGPDHSQVVFRSRSLAEPFVPAPRNPILTQRDLDPARPNPVIALGHADLVETGKDEWCAVFLGIRPYEQGKSNIGRETFLLPVTWKNDWPTILEKGRVLPTTLKRPLGARPPRGAPATTGSFTWRDEFDSQTLDLPWLFLRTPRERWWSLTSRPGSLLIEPRGVPLHSVGRVDPKANGNPSFVARRLQHANFQATTALDVHATTADSDAGLATLQNDTSYLFLGVRIRDTRAREIFLERRSKASDSAEVIAREVLPADARRFELRLEGTGKFLSFFYRAEGAAAWQSLRTGLDGSLLSTQDAGGFVGATLGLYARSVAPSAPVTPAPAAAAAPAVSGAAAPAVATSAAPAPAVAPASPELGLIKPLVLVAATTTAPWAANFADGTPAIDVSKGFTSADIIPHGIPSDSGLIQTFAGNGQKLKAVAFLFTGSSAPRGEAKFTLTLLDFGDADPAQNVSAINYEVPVLASAEFTWTTTSAPRQYYFDLSSANVSLVRGRRYAVALRFPGARSAQTTLRTTIDAMPGGRVAFGQARAYAYDFAGGDRDLHFAVYTGSR